VRRLGSAWPASVALLASALSACGSGSGGRPGSISVVASTNVYGSIVEQIAGPLSGGKVRVTSIISDPTIDPHSYEANARNQLAVSRADLIVENGGGYDDFVDTLRRAAGAHAPVVDAVRVSGKPLGDSFNEHVWYDFPTVAAVVDRIAGFLAAHDRRDAPTFRANARALIGTLDGLAADAELVRKQYAGVGVAVTEPVPLYLLSACGLVNRTPAQFSQAVEDGTDVSPRALQAMRDLFSAHRVRLLVYNEQTSGAETDAVLSAARANHVPTVPVTETLPSGKSYSGWMRANLDAVAAALGLVLN
jgi:zinc/manganese transport system substrate-binding protein